MVKRASHLITPPRPFKDDRMHTPKQKKKLPRVHNDVKGETKETQHRGTMGASYLKVKHSLRLILQQVQHDLRLILQH